MASAESESSDFYAVLGLKRDCSAKELRSAYKKLALKWHPDRCSASRNSKFVEEAKKKFQAIHEAYSVLSYENERFLYDVRAYDSSDDESGMDDFLEEMATMMSQHKPSENVEESFEELQELFEKMFERDKSGFRASSSSTCSSSSSRNRHSSIMSCGKPKGHDGMPSKFSSCRSSFFEASQGFCVGAGDSGGGGGRSSTGKRRNGKKSKVSSHAEIST